MLTGLAFGRVKVQYILLSNSFLSFFFFADQIGLWTLWTAWLRVHKNQITYWNWAKEINWIEERQKSDEGVEYTAL